MGLYHAAWLNLSGSAQQLGFKFDKQRPNYPNWMVRRFMVSQIDLGDAF